MTPEESQELKELVEFLKSNGIAEFEFERGETKIRIRFGTGESAASFSFEQLSQLLAVRAGEEGGLLHHGSITKASVTGAAPAAEPEDDDAGLHIVKSPIVGTFYESPSPGAPPFVKIGDQVESGQVICIVEAMKLMNEIESDAAGEIVKRYVTSGQPVEFGQKLFGLKSL